MLLDTVLMEMDWMYRCQAQTPDSIPPSSSNRRRMFVV